MSVHFVPGEVTSAFEARPWRWHAVDVSFSTNWPSEVGRQHLFA
jgi:hypothetical protein